MLSGVRANHRRSGYSASVKGRPALKRRRSSQHPRDRHRATEHRRARRALQSRGVERGATPSAATRHGQGAGARPVPPRRRSRATRAGPGPARSRSLCAFCPHLAGRSAWSNGTARKACGDARTGRSDPHRRSLTRKQSAQPTPRGGGCRVAERPREAAACRDPSQAAGARADRARQLCRSGAAGRCRRVERGGRRPSGPARALAKTASHHRKRPRPAPRTCQ
jgi:hypothetical protein